MLTIGLSQEVAEDALLLLGRHLPHDVEFGRPRIAQRDGDEVVFVTDGGWFWVSERGVSRLLPVDRDRAELTAYREGIERDRTLGTAG
jgi:hypothetical protein